MPNTLPAQLSLSCSHKYTTNPVILLVHVKVIYIKVTTHTLLIQNSCLCQEKQNSTAWSSSSAVKQNIQTPLQTAGADIQRLELVKLLASQILLALCRSMSAEQCKTSEKGSSEDAHKTRHHFNLAAKAKRMKKSNLIEIHTHIF